jgi:hypothetical protein
MLALSGFWVMCLRLKKRTLCVCVKQVLKCAKTYKMCIMSQDMVEEVMCS